MAKYDPPSGQDSLDFALRELATLENRVQALEGRRLSTWDRGAHADVPAPTEGQHVVEHDSEAVWYYSNGEWRALSSAPTWCRLSGVTAATTVTSGTDKQLVFLTETNDDTSRFQINSSREIQVLADGLYSIQGQANWGTYTDLREIYSVYNASGGVGKQGIGVSVSPFNDYTFVSDVQRFAVNDKVTLWVHQDSGSSHTIGGDECHLEVRFLGTCSTTSRFDF